MKRKSMVVAVLICLSSMAHGLVDYCWVSNIPPNFNLYTDGDGTMVYSSSSLISNNCNYPNGAGVLSRGAVGGSSSLTFYVPKSDPNYLVIANEILLSKANGSTLNVMIRTTQFHSTYGYPIVGVNIQ